jgi:allantoin racemase
VLLINPNSNPETTARMVAIAEAAAPDCAVTGVTAADGPRMIVDEAGLATGAASVAAMARAVRDRFDGAVVSAFGDPGLADASRIQPCPVRGIDAASFDEAAAGGRRFAVVTTTPGLVAAIAARVAAAGPSARFLGTWVTPGDPAAAVGDATCLDAPLSAEIGRARRWRRGRHHRRRSFGRGRAAAGPCRRGPADRADPGSDAADRAKRAAGIGRVRAVTASGRGDPA